MIVKFFEAALPMVAMSMAVAVVAVYYDLRNQKGK